MTYGKKMKEICTQLGVDVDSLPDKLYSTLLDAIAENAGSGSEITLDNINITENGTYTAETGHAYKKAVVDVPQEEPTLVEKSITENGTYTAADEAADGYSSVTVNVEPEQPTLVSKEITENGTYTAAAEEADGFSQVVVNVASSAGFSETDIATRQNIEKLETTENVAFASYCFAGFSNLKKVKFSNVSSTQSSTFVFYGCSRLVYVDFGSGEMVLSSNFMNAVSSNSIKVFKAENTTYIGGNALRNVLQKCGILVLRKITNIDSQGLQSFGGHLIITTTEVPTIASNVFSSTGIHGGTKRVYVKDAMVSSFKAATNWATEADNIYGYSEAPEYLETTTYNIGDVCKYNGKFYGYCKEDLTSSTGNAPSGTTSDNTYWEYIDDITT